MNTDTNLKKWLKKQKFIVFGAGQMGTNLMHILERYDSFYGFVDNDKEKQLNGWMGMQVSTLEFGILKHLDCKIIISCAEKHRKEMMEQCKALNLCYLEDFACIDFFLNEIMPLYVLRNFQEVYISLAQICVTERCTLRCKKCAHGCYAVPIDMADMPIDSVKYSADCFFSHIDYIDKFHLIGGEPFLYCDLAEAIAYIGDKYLQKIQTLCITTNGTVLPNEDVLMACKKYHVKILISNYAYSMPKLEKIYSKLVRILNEHGIDYVLGDVDKSWTDYGFDHVDRGMLRAEIDSQEARKKLSKVFSNCKTPCREIRGNRLYYCVQARACAENLGFSCGQDDYLDLSKLDSSYEGKKQLIDFEMGNLKKGYLDMCNYCHGAERFHYIIPAAEQKES